MTLLILYETAIFVKGSLILDVIIMKGSSTFCLLNILKFNKFTLLQFEMCFSLANSTEEQRSYYEHGVCDVVYVFFAILNSVSAVNVGYIGALNDYIGSVSVGAGDGTLTIPIDPAGNDGFIEKRNDGTAIINIFHSCNDQPASAKSWPNKGLKTNSKLNWVLEGGVKYQDVTSAHAGIRGAYFFNGSTGYTRVGTTSVSDDSYKDLLTGANAINTSSATFELWVRAHASDLTQFSTLFECGGGTGTGIAIDNGVLVVANNIAKGKVTYNLLTDPKNVLIDECTNEFFQVVFVIDLGSGYNSLYVNGSLIGTASNSGVTDWDGGDGTSLGRFTGTNLGGFINGAANTRYDTYYYGAISIFKIYAGALSADMITHNYNAIHNNTNKSGDPIMVSGIYTNATDVDRRVDADIKLPSGSVMRRSSVDNSLTYTPALSWELYNLWAGMLAPDTFKYEVVDGNSSTNTAEVTLNIQPGSEAEPDEFTVTQGETRHFKRSELVRNDQQILMSPWFELNSAAVTEDDIAAGLWRNLGSSGASRDFTVAGDFVEVASGFGGIGRAWRNVAGFGVGA